MARIVNAALALLVMVNWAPPSWSLETKDLPPSVTVTGEGHVFARPNQANISMGVISEAKTAAVALANNSEKMATLLKTLASKGIAEKDILTSNFNVSPQYRYENLPNGQQKSSITGYQVSNEVQVKVRNLPGLGDVLDAIVTAGANNVNGISFSIAEPDGVLDQARVKAVADAKRKAELYAGAAGTKIGRVLYITESSGTIQPPRPMMMTMARAEMAQAVPIASGEQETSASITIVYAIE